MSNNYKPKILLNVTMKPTLIPRKRSNIKVPVKLKCENAAIEMTKKTFVVSSSSENEAFLSCLQLSITLGLVEGSYFTVGPERVTL